MLFSTAYIAHEITTYYNLDNVNYDRNVIKQNLAQANKLRKDKTTTSLAYLETLKDSKVEIKEAQEKLYNIPFYTDDSKYYQNIVPPAYGDSYEYGYVYESCKFDSFQGCTYGYVYDKENDKLYESPTSRTTYDYVQVSDGNIIAFGYGDRYIEKKDDKYTMREGEKPVNFKQVQAEENWNHDRDVMVKTVFDKEGNVVNNYEYLCGYSSGTQYDDPCHAMPLQNGNTIFYKTVSPYTQGYNDYSDFTYSIDYQIVDSEYNLIKEGTYPPTTSSFSDCYFSNYVNKYSENYELYVRQVPIVEQDGEAEAQKEKAVVKKVTISKYDGSIISVADSTADEYEKVIESTNVDFSTNKSTLNTKEDIELREQKKSSGNLEDIEVNTCDVQTFETTYEVSSCYVGSSNLLIPKYSEVLPTSFEYEEHIYVINSLADDSTIRELYIFSKQGEIEEYIQFDSKVKGEIEITNTIHARGFIYETVEDLEKDFRTDTKHYLIEW